MQMSQIQIKCVKGNFLVTRVLHYLQTMGQLFAQCKTMYAIHQIFMSEITSQEYFKYGKMAMRPAFKLYETHSTLPT